MLKFVFADENDVYYRDSLVALNLNDYLYCYLKSEACRCDDIYYVSADEIETFNAELKAKLESGNKSFLPFFKKNKKKEPVDEICDKVAELLENQGSAFIFSLKSFCEMYQDSNRLQQLLKAINSVNASTFTILIKVPVVVDNCMECFTSENSVFKQEVKGLALSSTLKEILQRNCCLFEEMNASMHEQCIFLNSFSKENIRKVIKRITFVEHPDWSCTEKEEKDMCDGVYGYYHGRDARGIGSMFNTNETHSFSVLKGDLDKSFMMILRKLRENPKQPALTDDYNNPIDEPPCVIYKDNALVNRIKNRLPEIKAWQCADNALHKKIIDCVESLQRPCTYQIQTSVEEEIYGLVEMLSRICSDIYSKSNKVLMTERKLAQFICDALEYGMENGFSFEKGDPKYDKHKTLIETSKKILEGQKRIEKYETQCEQKKAELENCDNEIIKITDEYTKERIDRILAKVRVGEKMTTAEMQIYGKIDPWIQQTVKLNNNIKTIIARIKDENDHVVALSQSLSDLELTDVGYQSHIDSISMKKRINL